MSPLYASGTECCRRSRINKAALRHYMNNFDFSNLRLDQAFRSVNVPRTFDIRLTRVYVSSDRKSTRLNSSHSGESRMPSSA